MRRASEYRMLLTQEFKKIVHRQSLYAYDFRILDQSDYRNLSVGKALGKGLYDTWSLWLFLARLARTF